jgi:phosphate transport system protein
MQTHFELELEKLKNRIIKMGNLAIQQTSLAMHILLRGDTEQIETAAKTEHKIDKLDVKVDKLCQRIFALQQPVATDLRFIMSSLRIGNELERIGDIAMSIVNKSEIVREQPEILNIFNIEQVMTKSYCLIQQSFQNYTAFNAENIDDTILQCHQLKDECQAILDKVIIEMTQKSEVIIVATNLIIILRQVERLADHASNIAESIYFMNEGTIIKHGKKRDNTNL